jgi:hypothetical protein
MVDVEDSATPAVGALTGAGEDKSTVELDGELDDSRGMPRKSPSTSSDVTRLLGSGPRQDPTRGPRARHTPDGEEQVLLRGEPAGAEHVDKTSRPALPAMSTDLQKEDCIPAHVRDRRPFS